jgi:hypothetical protein
LTFSLELRDAKSDLDIAFNRRVSPRGGENRCVSEYEEGEPVFGNMKWNRKRLMMSMRGKKKVKGEFLLMCLARHVERNRQIAANQGIQPAS